MKVAFKINTLCTERREIHQRNVNECGLGCLGPHFQEVTGTTVNQVSFLPPQKVPGIIFLECAKEETDYMAATSAGS